LNPLSAIIASDSAATRTKRLPQPPSLDCFALLAMTVETIRLERHTVLQQAIQTHGALERAALRRSPVRVIPAQAGIQGQARSGCSV
jgi:hypothetical protein